MNREKNKYEARMKLEKIKYEWQPDDNQLQQSRDEVEMNTRRSQENNIIYKHLLKENSVNEAICEEGHNKKHI